MDNEIDDEIDEDIRLFFQICSGEVPFSFTHIERYLRLLKKSNQDLVIETGFLIAYNADNDISDSIMEFIIYKRVLEESFLRRFYRNHPEINNIIPIPKFLKEK